MKCLPVIELGDIVSGDSVLSGDMSLCLVEGVLLSQVAGTEGIDADQAARGRSKSCRYCSTGLPPFEILLGEP